MNRNTFSCDSHMQASILLGKRQSRKVGNNTYLEKLNDGDIGVRLHNTYIVRYTHDGKIILNSGGWRTVTTKARINKFIPSNCYVSQEKFYWYFHNRHSNARFGFYDGLEIVQ